MGKKMGESAEHSTRKGLTPNPKGRGVTVEDVRKDIPRGMPERRQGPEHD